MFLERSRVSPLRWLPPKVVVRSCELARGVVCLPEADILAVAADLGQQFWGSEGSGRSCWGFVGGTVRGLSDGVLGGRLGEWGRLCLVVVASRAVDVLVVGKFATLHLPVGVSDLLRPAVV